MRKLALLTVLLLAPLHAAAQDAPQAELQAAPLPAPAATDLAAPSAHRDLGLYVGVGLGSNLNLGGGSFGYQLEASVGLFYRMLAVEILGGSTTINGNQNESVGPHVGGAVRVIVFSNDSVRLQLGAGARYHSGRSQNGLDDTFTGGFASLRLLLPVSDNIAVRIDSEIEHGFDGSANGVASNRLMLGFGIETRVSP